MSKSGPMIAMMGMLMMGGLAWWLWDSCYLGKFGFAPTKCPRHTKCVDNKCSLVYEQGTNECTSDSNCTGTTQPPIDVPPPPDSCEITKTCSCGEVWDKVLCQCDVLIPEVVRIQNETTEAHWQVITDCAGGVKYTTTGLFPCPDYILAVDWYNFVKNRTDSQTFELIGSVEDSAGTGICNQIIEISLSQYESPWEDSWGVAFGRFQYSHPASVTTDSIGKFKIPITVNIVPIGHDGYKCFQSLIPGQSSEPNPDVTQILVDVRISKTQIVGGGSLVINNFICDYRHWGLIF